MSADLLELMLELTSNKLPGIKNHGLVCQCSPHFHNSGFFQWHIWALNWSVDAYYVSQPKFVISLFSKFEYQSFTSSSRLTWMPGLLGVTGVVMSTFYLGFAYFSTRKFGENTPFARSSPAWVMWTPAQSNVSAHRLRKGQLISRFSSSSSSSREAL